MLPEARTGGGGSAFLKAIMGVLSEGLPFDAATLHIDLSISPPTIYDLDRQSASEFAAALVDHPKSFVVVDVRSSRGVSGTYAPTLAWDTVSVATRTGAFTRPAAKDLDAALGLAAGWWKGHHHDELQPGRAADVAARISAGGSAEVVTLPLGYLHNTVALFAAAIFLVSGGALIGRGVEALRTARAARRVSRGMCPVCTYPHAGPGRCPECGSGTSE